MGLDVKLEVTFEAGARLLEEFGRGGEISFGAVYRRVAEIRDQHGQERLHVLAFPVPQVKALHSGRVTQVVEAWPRCSRVGPQAGPLSDSLKGLRCR